MKILVLHSRYRSGDLSGENRVVDDETRLLRDAGHDVVSWTPTVPDDANRAALAVETLWSSSALDRVRATLRDGSVDVVHIHNVFPLLSPAILRAVRDVPTIMTLHNFRLMCLPATLLRDGRICEDCVGRAPWRGVVHRCYRGSAAASATLAASMTLHRHLKSYDSVALFSAVGEFVRTKHIEAGIHADRIVVRPNFAWPATTRVGPGSYFLCIGRLSPEKGVGWLIDNWPSEAPRLMVVGEGPESSDVRRRARHRSNIEVADAVSADAVTGLIRSSRAVVLPSLWFEAAPRIIVEAYAAGVPVIANRIGGLPDQVIDQITGLLAEVGDSHAWTAAITRLSDDEESIRLGGQAHDRWSTLLSPPAARNALEALYDQVLHGSGLARAARE